MFSNKHIPFKYGFDLSKPPSLPPCVAEQLPLGQETRFSTSSDESLWLFSRSWEPPQEARQEVKATLIICHGTVDHSGVYDELAQALASEGVAVFAQDMRGWGLSDGESMYLNDIETFVEDVDHFYEEIHRKPEYAKVKNRFLLGKSIGGIVTAYAVARHPNKFSGLIGLSGAYAPHPDHAVNPLKVVIVKILNTFAPKLPLKQVFDPKLIVKDKSAFEDWYNDPLCSKDKVRVGYASEAMRCRKELPSLIKDIGETPMLMMIGLDDRVVSLEGLKMMTNHGSNKNAKINTYDGGYHNLLAEPTLKKKVIGDIKEWILGRISSEAGTEVAQ